MTVFTCLLSFAAPAMAQSSRQAKTRTNTSEIQKSAPAETAPAPAPAGEAQPAAVMQITAVTVAGSALQTDMRLATEGAPRLRAFVLANPYRLVVEADALAFADNLPVVIAPGSAVSDYRYGQADHARGRIVFDLAGPMRIERFARVAGQAHLVLSAATADIVSARLLDPPQTLADEARDAAPFETKVTPETARRDWPVIMIDPGHGGRDPGAVADGGLLEKDVVLAVALRLRDTLAGLGRFDVRMTRDSDTAVALDRRVALSRSANADLFISLHVDTFAGQAQAAAIRGGSVYILSDKASNRLAQALADKENTADQRAGVDGSPETGDAAVDGILSDLMVRETHAFSTAFQSVLVQSLRKSITLAREPARGAAFRVLNQAGSPAVLVELGYMSNGQDIALLQSAAWQAQVAASIARAVETYFAMPKQSVVQR